MELQHPQIPELAHSNLFPQDAEVAVHPHFKLLQREMPVDLNACIYKCPQMDPSDSAHGSTPASDLPPSVSPAKYRNDDLRGQVSTLNKLQIACYNRGPLHWRTCLTLLKVELEWPQSSNPRASLFSDSFREQHEAFLAWLTSQNLTVNTHCFYLQVNKDPSTCTGLSVIHYYIYTTLTSCFSQTPFTIQCALHSLKVLPLYCGSQFLNSVFLCIESESRKITTLYTTPILNSTCWSREER